MDFLDATEKRDTGTDLRFRLSAHRLNGRKSVGSARFLVQGLRSSSAGEAGSFLA
jgi:hypothetical protein